MTEIGKIIPPCPACVSEIGRVDPTCELCHGSGACPSASPEAIPAGDAQVDLDAIKAREAAATKGPWTLRFHVRSSDPNEHDEWIVVFEALTGSSWADDSTLMDRPDAQFIAHARQDIPALLAEVNRLRSALSSRAPETDTQQQLTAERLAHEETLRRLAAISNVHETAAKALASRASAPTEEGPKVWVTLDGDGIVRAASVVRGNSVLARAFLEPVPYGMRLELVTGPVTVLRPLAQPSPSSDAQKEKD